MTETNKGTDIAPVEKPKQYKTTRIEGAEFKRNVWVLVPEAGTPFAAILKPEYWAHVAAKLNVWDRIEVRYEHESGAYHAELLVRAVHKTSVVVKQLAYVALDDKTVTPGNGNFEVSWSGPHTKYRVVRKDDKIRLLEHILAEPVRTADGRQGTTIVFSRTKHGAAKITRVLKRMGHTAAEIHSNRSLNQRKDALEGFKTGRYRVLVAPGAYRKS